MITLLQNTLLRIVSEASITGCTAYERGSRVSEGDCTNIFIKNFQYKI